MSIDIKDAQVGDLVEFLENWEETPYEVRARSARFLVCTYPVDGTVMYTIIDLERGVRGTENLIFGYGAETTEQCQEMVARLESHTEVSSRNYVTLAILRVTRRAPGRPNNDG